MSEREVWVIDDDRSIRWVLEKALSQSGVQVRVFDGGKAALGNLDTRPRPAAVITDVRMPDVDGFSVLNAIGQKYPGLPVIIMTAYSDLDSTVSAYQGGAFEYLAKPFDVDEAVALVRRALAASDQQIPDAGQDEQKELPEREIVGSAPAMQEVFRAIGRLSRSNITVLITGESGTGKELVARALHRHSPRAQQPFIALNTAAIPADLLESELFGHERGAFTGAQTQRIGRFEQADRGTLFLDEIGDMPADLQTRLLRVLSDGEFYRVGGHTSVKVDVRIIAATHQDLDARVRANAFREDLYHRLNVIRVHTPALRERKEDIADLLTFFLSAAASELGTETKVLRPETLSYLEDLEWAGNVRQLENTCRWLTVMASGKEIHLDDLPPELKQPDTSMAPGASLLGATHTTANSWEAGLREWADRALNAGQQAIADTALPRFEQVLIESALKSAGGRRQDAAKLLGWGRNTLTRKIKEHGIQ